MPLRQQKAAATGMQMNAAMAPEYDNLKRLTGRIYGFF